MLSKNKNVIVNFIGVIYLVFGIVAILNTVYSRHQQAPILWICYVGLILLGIGALRKNDLLIVSQLNILAIPLIIWSVDFFYVLFTGGSLLGISNYFFVPGPTIAKVVTSQHLFTIPAGIYLLYLIKIKSKKMWIVSLIEVSFLFFASRFFSSPEENVNCVYSSCAGFDLPMYYPFSWFLSYFVMIMVVNFVLMRIKWLRK